MGAVALNVVKQDVVGDKRAVVADVTFSSSYATGGDTVSLGNLGLREVDEAHVLTGTFAPSAIQASKAYAPNAHGVQVVLAGSPTAPKLKVFQGTTSEVANATNLSTVPAVRVEFRGS
jgi:hypothetical protein